LYFETFIQVTFVVTGSHTFIIYTIQLLFHWLTELITNTTNPPNT